MKKLILALLVGTFALPTYASQADCAIWLCLPTGFPEGCDDAKNAFAKRIKHLKPPLPPLASCLVSTGDEGGNADMSYKQNIEVLVPAHTTCDVQTGGGDDNDGIESITFYGNQEPRGTNCKTTPEKWVKKQDGECEDDMGSITCQTRNSLTIYDGSGAQVGDPFHW